MKATWNNTVIAESDDTVVVERNHYFPDSSVNHAYLEASEKTTSCPWKGVAHYYTPNVDGQKNIDAAWYYPAPKSAVKQIEGRVAFWRGVKVTE